MWRPKESEGSSSAPSISDSESLDLPPPEPQLEISDIIGGYGPWQRDIFVLLFLASIPSAWHNLQMTFMAPTGVEYWCARPDHLNVSVEEWLNFSAPPPHLKLDSRCYVTPYWRLPDNETIHESDLLKCTSWEYNSNFYPSTIIDEVQISNLIPLLLQVQVQYNTFQINHFILHSLISIKMFSEFSLKRTKSEMLQKNLISVIIRQEFIFCTISILNIQ